MTEMFGSLISVLMEQLGTYLQNREEPNQDGDDGEQQTNDEGVLAAISDFLNDGKHGAN